MRFELDENLPERLAEVLAGRGHDAATARSQGLQGSQDEAIFDVRTREDRVLMTLDLDFADARFYPYWNSPGVIVFRPRIQEFVHLERILRGILKSLDDEQLANRLWIVEDSRIRIRGKGA